MSKTKEELDAIKEEVEAVDEKLQELTPEELAQVNGGVGPRRSSEEVIEHVDETVSSNKWVSAPL